MRTFFRRSAAGLALLSALLFSAIGWLAPSMPDSFSLPKGNSLQLAACPFLKSDTVRNGEASPVSAQAGDSKAVTLRLFGIIPVTQTRVHTVSRPRVIPCGTPFGIKLYTEGVVVVDLSAIETAEGTLRPAQTAGIRKGDVLLAVGGTPICSNEEIASCIEKSGGNPVTVTFRRGETPMEATLTPALSLTDARYRCGIWVRDSSAGIGTLTYYDAVNGTFAGLGHAICDVDTGQILPLQSGEVCPVRIDSVKKGMAGTPGELRGAFSSMRPLGTLLCNHETGVFGTLDSCPVESDAVELGFKQEITPGEATLYCTLEQNTVHAYSVTIESIDLNPKTQTKNMVIRVTDPELLRRTGGIVQGMSGSPILQNGRLIGAVTHVFVNDPTRGYAIFAENMLETASLALENEK